MVTQNVVQVDPPANHLDSDLAVDLHVAMSRKS